MPSSVIPTKLALMSLMQAWAWPTSAPDVRWGGPTETEDYPRSGELVYFFDVRDLDDESPTLGATRIDERYAVRLHVDVRMDGDDEQATETRGWQLYDSLRRLLFEHHNLIEAPGELTVMLQGRTVNQQNIALPQAWLTRVIVDQSVLALVFNP